MRWRNLTLRTQVTVLIFCAALLIEVVSTTADTIRLQEWHDTEILNRSVAFILEAAPVLEKAPGSDRAAVALSFASSERSLRLSDENVALQAQNQGGSAHPKVESDIRKLLAQNGLTVSSLDVDDEPILPNLSERSAFLDFHILRNTRPPTNLEIAPQQHARMAIVSVQLPNIQEWINFYILLAPINITSILLERLLDASIALVLVAVVVVLIGRVMRPLERLTTSAEQLGRGEDIGALPIEGSANIRVALAAFNRMSARLKQSIDYQTSLLRSLGHDLRGPLGELRALTADVPPEADRRRMLQWLARLDGIVASVTEFTRMTRKDGATGRIDLASLLEVIVETAADAGQDVSMAPADEIIVRGRHNALVRLFQNVVENAVKYGGAAHVSISHDDDYAIINVDDDGPGIDPSKLEAAFEPFERLGAAGEGTGLGLPIVRTIVLDHGGEITLKNRSEGGLRAQIRLPLEPRH